MSNQEPGPWRTRAEQTTAELRAAIREAHEAMGDLRRLQRQIVDDLDKVNAALKDLSDGVEISATAFVMESVERVAGDLPQLLTDAMNRWAAEHGGLALRRLEERTLEQVAHAITLSEQIHRAWMKEEHGK